MNSQSNPDTNIANLNDCDHYLLQSQRMIIDGAEQPATLEIKQGEITAIHSFDVELSLPLFDCGAQVLMPGLVDSHVHVNEPGRTEWEGFDTATHAAAAGGITTLVDMPLNCIPVTTSAAALKEKLDHIADKLWIDCGFWGGATADNLDDLPALLDAGVLGVKSFTIDSGIDEFSAVDEQQLLVAMRILASYQRPHLVHAELDTGNATPESGIGRSYQSFLTSRPKSWENDAIQMVIRVMRQLSAEGLKPHAHIVHLSSAQALKDIRAAKHEGLNLTVETCPHYLVLWAENIPDGDTRFKCCPPIREDENREQLWQAVQEGLIDCLVSDHSPCTPQLKHIDSGDLEAAWGGVSGLQFGLSLLWSEARERQFPLEKLLNAMAATPAKLAGLGSKGEIAIGKAADFCIFAPDEQYEIKADMIHHRHKVTPYEGRIVYGVVKQTILAGKVIFSNGDFLGAAGGKTLQRT